MEPHIDPVQMDSSVMCRPLSTGHLGSVLLGLQVLASMRSAGVIFVLQNSNKDKTVT